MARRAWSGPPPSPTTAHPAAFSATVSPCPGEHLGPRPDAPRTEPGDPRTPDAAGAGERIRPRSRGTPGRPPGPGHESSLRRPVDPLERLPARGTHPTHAGATRRPGHAHACHITAYDGGRLPAVASRVAAGAHPLHEIHSRKAA